MYIFTVFLMSDGLHVSALQSHQQVFVIVKYIEKTIYTHTHTHTHKRQRYDRYLSFTGICKFLKCFNVVAARDLSFRLLVATHSFKRMRS